MGSVARTFIGQWGRIGMALGALWALAPAHGENTHAPSSRPRSAERAAGYQMAGPTFTPPAADAKLPYNPMVDYYENKMRYLSGKQRYRHPEGTFLDVPVGGTGKIIIARAGPQRQIIPVNDLVEIRVYPPGSPEAKEIAFWKSENIHALGIDGLGRKISRYDSVEQALSSINQARQGVGASEVELLRRYLAAKQSQRALVAKQQPTNAPVAAASLPTREQTIPARIPSAPASMPVAATREAPPLPTFFGPPPPPESTEVSASTAHASAATPAPVATAPRAPAAHNSVAPGSFASAWVGYLSDEGHFAPPASSATPIPDLQPLTTPTPVAQPSQASALAQVKNDSVPPLPSAGSPWGSLPSNPTPAVPTPVSPTPASPQVVPATSSHTPAATATPALPVNHPPLSTAFNPGQLGSFIQNNCIQCHANGTITHFPAFTQDWAQWESLLKAGNPEAKTWLTQFKAKVVHGEMLAQAKLDKRSGPGKDFHDFVAAQSARYLSPAPAARGYGVRLTDPAKNALYDSVLANANIGDPNLREKVQGFDLMWDDVGNPTWSWAPHGGDSGRKGARPLATTNPAGPVSQELFAGRQWKEPFSKGFALGPNTQGLNKFSLVRFPRDASGQLIKAVRGLERHTRIRSGPNGGWGNLQDDPNDLNNPWASFPAGTHVFEVLYADVNGKPTPVDIVGYEKRIGADGVAMMVPNALRVDSSPEKIRAWVNAQTDSNPDYARILAAVNNPVQDAIVSNLGRGNVGGTPFTINNRPSRSIPGTKSVAQGVSPETWERLYRELPMESASGLKGWQLEAGDVFSGSHRGIAVNAQSCKNCHRFAGEPFRDIFEQSRLDDANVYAYGDGPGYDAVLGAPWFSPEALSLYSQDKFTYEMRSELAPFFENYDPRRHSPSQYRRNDDGPLTNNPLRNPSSAR